MGRIKTCGAVCHNAKGTRCLCWCGGTFHGAAGTTNREELSSITSEPEKIEYLIQHGFIKGKSKYKEQTKMEFKEIEPSSMILLPPAPGLCQECAIKHDPCIPHNQQSLYYQTSFYLKNKRYPTWKDAMAHCSKEIQVTWLIRLKEFGVKID